mmetsp:Transcript_12307/g.19087  ORF Transcript_12307/g.19087 Transcript_12307/m.19087 type:complete len:101 (+) Transcript_12307:2269-2571(+)
MIENDSQNCNVFQGMADEEKSNCRKQILENILYTDMSKHGQVINEIKALGELPEEERKTGTDNKLTVLRAAVHAADICNSARPFAIAKHWALNVFSEFFN